MMWMGYHFLSCMAIQEKALYGIHRVLGIGKVKKSKSGFRYSEFTLTYDKEYGWKLFFIRGDVLHIHLRVRVRGK